MRQYRLGSAGDGEPLQAKLVADAEMPKPQAGQVLVRVKACSLNYRDLLMLAGQSGSGGGGSVVPLSDGAGEVAAVGEGVTQFAVGDQVAGCFFHNVAQFGRGKWLGQKIELPQIVRQGVFEFGRYRWTVREYAAQ